MTKRSHWRVGEVAVVIEVRITSPPCPDKRGGKAIYSGQITALDSILHLTGSGDLCVHAIHWPFAIMSTADRPNSGLDLTSREAVREMVMVAVEAGASVVGLDDETSDYGEKAFRRVAAIMQAAGRGPAPWEPTECGRV